MDGVRGFQAETDEGVLFIDLRDTIKLNRLRKMSGFIVANNDSQEFCSLQICTLLPIYVLQK